MFAALITLVFSGFMNSVMTIHLPKGVEYHEVCVYSAGRVDNRMYPGEYIDWYAMSCWKPRFSVEDYRFREGVYAVLVHLTLTDGTTHQTIVTPVRPLEE